MYGHRFLEVLAVGVAWGVLTGCSGSPSQGGPNEACFRALDCRDGLVCIDGRCTTDIAPIVPESGGAAPALGAGADGGPGD